MSYSDGGGGSAPIFYIGHHETKPRLAVSSELVQHAQDLGVGAFQAQQEGTMSMLTLRSMT
jgi:hypothetical protein